MSSTKTSLSVKSKVFVAKNPKQSEETFKSYMSANNLDFSILSTDKASLKNTYCVNFARTKSNSRRSGCGSPDSIAHSHSTDVSLKNASDSDMSSETSESSPCGRVNINTCHTELQYLQANTDCSNYNNLYQKHPIRNLTRNESYNEIEESLSTTESDKLSSNEPKKQVKRRAGRKHKAKKAGTLEQPKEVKETIKFKTEMCKNWLEKGKCSYSVRCRFAHGDHELIKPIEDKKEVEEYKSKPCTAYHKEFYCPYGVRCLFIHDTRTTKDICKSYYQLSFKLRTEEGQTVMKRRLPVFEELAQCSE